MCDPITIGMVVGGLSSGLSIVGQNKAISSQQKQVSEQAMRAYAENDFKTSQEKKNALEKAHVASLEKDAAASKALVRTTSLGIRGISAGEKVNEELRVGDYNVGSGLAEYADATAANFITQKHTQVEAASRIDALQAERPSALGSIMSIATGTLGGYLTGSSIATNMGYEGTPFYSKMFGG